MGMALDEPKEEDLRFETDGLLWVITPQDQEQLLAGAQGFEVDYIDDWTGSGFVVRRVGAGGSSCGSCSC